MTTVAIYKCTVNLVAARVTISYQNLLYCRSDQTTASARCYIANNCSYTLHYRRHLSCSLKILFCHYHHNY